MGDRFQQRLGLPGASKRRKSFFRFIADSISSIVPSTLFGANNTDTCAEENYDDSLSRHDSCDHLKHGRTLQNSRDSDTQTITAVGGLHRADVDLDAADNSEGEMSAHSSTSGVSSLVPRNFTKPVGLKCNKYSVPTADVADGYLVHSRSATCSDVMDSIGSTSTFEPPSVTPWILSHGYRRPESPTVKPTKRQRISCDQSLNSSCESDRMSLFYRAKTTYGGAASCRGSMCRNGLFETTIPLRFELEQSRQNPPVRIDPVSSTNLSSTARRILANLERFTTPLTSADRVPLPVSASSDVGVIPIPVKKTFRSHRFPPYMQAYKRLKTMQHARYQSASISPTSSEASIVESVSVSSAPVAFTPSSSTSLPPTFVTSTIWSCEPGLGVSSSSGFAFQKMPLLRQSGSTESTTVTTTLPVSTRSDHCATRLSATTYTFASPIRRPPSVAAELVKLSSYAPPQFTFSSPIRSRSSSALFSSHMNESVSLRSTPTNTGAPTSRSPIFTLIVNSDTDQNAQTTSKTHQYLVSPRFETVEFRMYIDSFMKVVLIRAVELPCLLSEVHFCCFSVSESKVILPTFDLSKSWRCETCLLENPQTKQICSSCRMPHIKQNTTPVPVVTPAPSNTDAISSSHSTPQSVSTTLPAIPSNPFQCPVCTVFNETLLSECIDSVASCKSGSGQSASGFITNPPSIQTSTASYKSSKWECPTCMVFNDFDKVACVCCQTSNPNGVKSRPSAQWECPTCMVSNSSDKEKCPCCCTTKPQTSNSTTVSTTGLSMSTAQAKFAFSSMPTFTCASVFKFGLPVPMASSSTNTVTVSSARNSSGASVSAPCVTNSLPKALEHQTSKPTVLTSATASCFNSTFGNPISSTSSTPVVSPPFSFGIPAGNTSTVNSTPFSFPPPVPASQAGLVNASSTQSESSSSVFTVGRKRQAVNEAMAPVFHFGFSSAAKAPMTSLSNGLVNGDSAITLNSAALANKRLPTPVGIENSSGFSFTPASSQPGAPKFEFGTLKSASDLSNNANQSVFTFGTPFNSSQCVSTSSSTNCSITFSLPSSQTSSQSSTAPLGSSAPNQFVFGSSQPNFTSSSTNNVFCFGSNSQTPNTSETKPSVGFGVTTPLSGLSNASSSSSVFSTNATAIGARKKVHATRRLNR
ncbi:hypothetical protein D915_005364 [Fasciola hepatica]|uniref:RanBP2-type domain-containing protein n=1 Tax=Fasciola hepatica TaxID=6192 RepID=A0A4E0RB76_FASHE|nr:hypothetical protein D915_005364 [Fasciola hepatica]